jgi:hypothetical protein
MIGLNETYEAENRITRRIYCDYVVQKAVKYLANQTVRVDLHLNLKPPPHNPTIALPHTYIIHMTSNKATMY